MSRHAMGMWTWLALAVLIDLGAVEVGYAHGFGQRYDLPVPLWLYTTGAAAAVVCSFVIVGLFVRGTSSRHAYARLNLLHTPLGRCLAHPVLLFCCKFVSVSFFGLLILAGLFGTPDAAQNLAPTLVWVVWWVGLAYVSALFGNLWALLNPWKVLFEWAEACYRRVTHGAKLSLHRSYPRALGVWPGVLLLLLFAWVELVFVDAAVPAKLAGLVLLYSGITWTGMWLFGKEVWLRYGEAFSLVFGLLSRFSPTEVSVRDARVCQTCHLACRDRDGACIDCYACFSNAEATQRAWNLRPYAIGLARHENVSTSEMVFILLLLATVTFDGFMATPVWAAIETALQPLLAALGEARTTVIKTLGLLAFPLVFLELYVLFCVLMAAVSGGRHTGASLTRTFAFSLVPIAIAYHMAHYLSYLLIQGQRFIPLLSDPFGAGWNLFGTAAYRLNLAIVDARFGWYTAVIAIVVGHILAVYLAHRVALRTLRDHTLALRSQYPMLVLMVGYTVISLWILAQPIVESEASAVTPASASTAAPVQARQASRGVPDHTSVTREPRPERLLMALTALGQEQRQATDVEVRSSVLCFCLHKGPETIRELRRVAGQWFAKGLVAFQAERYEEALEAFSNAIQRYPQDALAYANRGITYGKLHRYPEARQDLATAVALDPHQAAAYHASGVVLLLMGQESQAIEQFRHAARLGYPAPFLSPESF